MNKEDKRFTVEASISALGSMVPFLAPFVSLYNDVRSDRERKRLEEMIEAIRSEVQSNMDQVNKNFISNSDFIEIFEKTSRKIIDERTEVKRHAFRNIIINSVFSPKSSYDELENQIRIMEQLNVDHIYILQLFYTPGYFFRNDSDSPNFRANTYHQILCQIIPWLPEKIEEHIIELEDLRLLKDVMNNFRIMMTQVTLSNFQNNLTKKGSLLIRYIMR